MLRWSGNPGEERVAKRLLRGASLVALASTLVITQASAATLGGLRAAAGLPPNAAPAPPQAPPGPAPLPPGQESARVRQLRNLSRITDADDLARQAQAAARAAAEAVAPTVPDGLVIGGLDPVDNPVPAAQDPTGLNTWQGANAPTQTQTDGHTTVTVQQTESRAVLSWETFNVGRDTTLQFDQKLNGAPQQDWVALNRIVGQLDPATGRRNAGDVPAPSQILGSIKADGMVLVLNQNGVLFGGTAQINVHSLVATSLEIGRAMSGTTPLTIKQRNDDFLAFGLLGFADQASGQDKPNAYTFSSQAVDATHNDPLLEGSIVVDAGAEIAASNGGFILLTGPKVENSGHLTSPLGQVSLQAGRQVTLTRSEGAPDSVDPNVRGLIVSVVQGNDAAGSYVLNTETGIIESAQGYISLGATDNGAVITEGVVRATTSVSRNGFIRFLGGDIRIAPGAAIAILPDTGDQTIPQDPISLDAFKVSRISIGSAGSRIEIGSGATIFAPGADIEIGAAPGPTTLADAGGLTSRIFIDTDVVIDASGMADVLIPASRNAIKIAPVKRNELRDSPTYREDFLNGATIYVDPRKSGVRADGVAWIGSPLVEAGSFYQQVGVTAAELLTKGGNVTLGVASFTGTNAALAPDIVVKQGAEIDVAGGWVRYEAGNVRESRLITASGRVVSVADADPNDFFVGIAGGFTWSQPRWGISETWTSPILNQTRYVGEYTEGRDAGSLTLKGSAVVLDGTVHGDAFAGPKQLADAAVGTATSGRYGDRRDMQGAPSQLPSGAFLFVQALGTSTAGNITGGADIAIVDTVQPLAPDLAYGQSVSVDASGNLVVPVRDPASFIAPERRDTIALSDDAINAMGVSQVSLFTSGKVTVAAGTETHINPGGVFDVLAGRSVTVDGKVFVPSGSIAIETANVGFGSAVVPDVLQAGSFDIVVNGTLSTRGRWVNDFGATYATFQGSANIDGGDITLVGAARQTLFPEVASVPDTESGAAPTENVDISGSILINDGALVDVSGGGYVAVNGELDLSARGGDLSLINETTYFQLVEDPQKEAGGIEGFRVSTLAKLGGGFFVPINPSEITARISIADGTVLAHGFAGGGTFNLTTPEFQFGDTAVTTGMALPMDFFSTAGFANYNITSYKTALIRNAFDNDFGGYNAVLATQTLTVGAGETLRLSQSMFNAVPTTGEVAALQALTTDGDLYSVLTPAIPAEAWDRRAVNLSLGGLLELHVEAGGRVEGEAGAVLTVAGLLNEGTIRLPGGTIRQSEIVPSLYTQTQVLAVHDLSEAFSTRPNGRIREDDLNAAGIGTLTNAQLAEQYAIYLLGDLNAGEGMRLTAGSVTDVSGTSIINPRAIPEAPGSATPIRVGTVIAGGRIESLAALQMTDAIFRPSFGFSAYTLRNPLGVRAANVVNAEAGAVIDISGAEDSFDLIDAHHDFVPTPQWSDAGSIYLGNGGSLTGALIDAHGGAEEARGGTLIMLDPTLHQTDPVGPALNAVSASLIEGSGFDTLVALGSVTSSGDVTLNLDGAFFLSTRPFGNFPGQDLSNPAIRDQFVPVVRSGGNLTINADYVRLESNFQGISSPTFGTPGGNSVTFNADTIDIAGAVLFDRSIANAFLNAEHDLRLTGVRPFQQTYGITGVDVPNSLAGHLAVNGNLSITAAQVYPTTGSTFLVTSTAATGAITFARSGEAAPPVYSAGGNLTVQAASIVQGGVIRVPLGRLTLGGTAPLTITTGTVTNTFAPATATVEATAGSITSVSADGLVIPYGTTTDQIEWFFEPTGASELNAPPAGVLSFNGTDIVLAQGADVDISGGGDVYAYEFISGTGGSRDELDRFNADAFSGNNGLQYPDGRQVYAIVPGLSDAAIAAFDPIYSSDYADLTGASGVGSRVYLNAAPGITAGWYTLLPAKYAMLPGGMRVVVRSDDAGLIPGASAKLYDGTVVATGYFGTTVGDTRSSQLIAFDVQSQPVFLSYSNITRTFANKTFADRAARDNLIAPRLPIDAGRLVLNPAATLAVNTSIISDPGEGGRGAQADISGESIQIVSELPAAPPPGVVVFTADSLSNLNASSLVIGGVRTENADGTTTLDVTASNIAVANDAAHPLSAPEVVLAVDGSGAGIAISDGAAIVATGKADAGGTFIVDGSRAGMTGEGAIVRVANGSERTVTRINPDAGVTPGVLDVGAATLDGESVLLDSSGDLSVSPLATIETDALALGAGKVTFTTDPTGLSGLVITPSLQALFGQADRLTISTDTTIDFSAGSYAFGNLHLNTPGLALLDGDAVDITADTLELSNTNAAGAVCAPACGTGSLTVAADEIVFGSGTVRTYGFGNAVALNANEGMFAQGIGTFDAGAAALAIDAPFIGDRALPLVPGQSALIPSLALNTTGDVDITGNAAAAGNIAGTPGAALAISGESIHVSGARLRATAGTLALKAQTDITVTGGAILETPGYAKHFGDAADGIDVSAPGGRLALTAIAGDIVVDPGATLSIGGGSGRAGTLALSASAGSVALMGTVESDAPDGGGSLFLNTGTAFDLSAFSDSAAHDFTGTIDIRTGAGDLVLAVGDTLAAENVKLTADGGRVDVAGTIDTSGANGGDIGLFGIDGVTLRATATLDAHAEGYAPTDTRRAEGGAVTLGTDGIGTIVVEAGAKIDVAAQRTADRLVPQIRNGVLYYTYVAGDRGGVITFRAPVIEQPGADTVNVFYDGDIDGARAIVLEGFKRFDLADVAANPDFVGVTINGSGQAELDLAATAPGRLNFLADDGAGTLVEFVQDFDISDAFGSLNGLDSSSVFHARPGMELDCAGDIVLVSNWNLGAGAVDVPAAVADGLMAELPSTPGKYFIIPGKEAEVFAHYTTMVYRTGGDVDGEPGVLTLRAGGTLDIKGSISDGFFQFRDQTDPDYLNLALGGGNQIYTGQLRPGCTQGCAGVPDWMAGVVPPTVVSVVIPGATGLQRRLQNPAPYSAAANSPAALGSLPGGTGDPFGSAELFPLLGGAAVESWSYRLVGGADLTSADPMRTAPGSAGKVVVEGERSYTFQASPGGTQQFDDEILFQAGSQFVSADQWLAAFLAANASLDQNAHTFVNFQSAPAAFRTFLSDNAETYFASFPGQFEFVGPPGAPTGVRTSLGLASNFMRDVIAPNFASFNDLYRPARPETVTRPTTAQVRTLVRSGTGDIAIAAASDVDLRNGETPTYRRLDGTNGTSTTGLQVGGTAVYTAGHRAIMAPRMVLDPVSGQVRLVDPGALASRTDVFANPPSGGYRYGAGATPDITGAGFLGVLLANPVYAEGGGDVSIEAGGDVLGRRDIWQQGRIDNFYNSTAVRDYSWIGTGDQAWRSGAIGVAPDVRIDAQLFSEGVGTLGGGDISIRAGGDVSDLSIVATTSISTATVAPGGGQGAATALATFGGGDVVVVAADDILGGRVDIGSGEGLLSAGRSIASAGDIRVAITPATFAANMLRLRLTDAEVTLESRLGTALQGITALGVHQAASRVEAGLNAYGFYSDGAAVSFVSDGAIVITNQIADPNRNPDVLTPSARATGFTFAAVYPGSLSAASLTGDVTLHTSGINVAQVVFLYPSTTGDLELLAAADIAPVIIAMDDGDPGLLPGAFSAYRADTNGTLVGRPFIFPGVLPDATDVELAQLHNQNITHANDPDPVRIYAGGDIVSMIVSVAKQARIGAGRDIVNMMFFGQNVDAEDITRITAGRDIVATTQLVRPVLSTDGVLGDPLPALQGNTFVIGGPGSFFLEAGRDAGPFLNSAVTDGFIRNQAQIDPMGHLTFGGGVLSVGNEWNPHLPAIGADVYVLFGVGGGVNYIGFRNSYLDPVNLDALDDDLFEQVPDGGGGFVADRAKPIYAPILIQWMKDHAATELVATFGTADVTYEQAYQVFAALPELRQRVFIYGKVYFNELIQTSIPDGPSFQQYSRGYRAVNTLFPAELGYTQNDLTGGSNGANETIETGNLDLRLATIQTARGGNIYIVGPGGRVLAGSTVRTSEQAARRAYIGANLYSGVVNHPSVIPLPSAITAIPLGYEGVLTLRGGSIYTFTDSDFLLNQSRLFTQAGGDVAMWSSNADLNAGQGPKTSANFPPVVVSIDENAFAEVDSVGGVTGAGIGALQPAPGVKAPDVFLIAPRGTVDAGDAGVRVSGSLFIAALTVANSENFSVGGSAVGIPGGAAIDVGAQTGASAAATAAQQAAQSAAGGGSGGGQSVITVEVLGYYGAGDDCPPDSQEQRCRERR